MISVRQNWGSFVTTDCPAEVKMWLDSRQKEPAQP
jgi:hypothetical protein